jgi:hypothetical protein
MALTVSNYPTDLNASELYPAGRGERGIIARRLKLVITSEGGASNTITAAELGFSKLLWCSNLCDTANGKIYLAVVDPTLNTLQLAATAADTAADVTSTASYITVVGTPTDRVN